MKKCLLVLGCVSLALAQEQTETPAPKPSPVVRPWIPLELTDSPFTADKIGILAIEAEELATFLVMLAHHEHAEGVRQGYATSHASARRLLALASHLCPSGVAVRQVQDWFRLGIQLTEPMTLPQTKAGFAVRLETIITKLESSPDQTDAIRACRGYLSLIGADLAPERPFLVYRAELFLRRFPSEVDAWRALHQIKSE